MNMRGLLIIFFVILSFASQAQKPVYTSDSLCYFTVPNTITANCSNADCLFRVIADCKAPSDNLFATASIAIFNRWGQKVYEVDLKDQKGWDGGEEKEGAYFWILTYYEFPSGAKTKRTATGSVTLIR